MYDSTIQKHPSQMCFVGKIRQQQHQKRAMMRMKPYIILIIALSSVLLFSSLIQKQQRTSQLSNAFFASAFVVVKSNNYDVHRRQGAASFTISGDDGWMMKMTKYHRQYDHPTTIGYGVRQFQKSAFVMKMASRDQSIPIEWRGDVLKQLKNIIDPDLGSDIVTLGFIKNLEKIVVSNSEDSTNNEKVMIQFDVELTTPACPVKDQFASDCIRLVEQLPWVDEVNVTMTAQPITTVPTDVFGMSKIGAVIAVSSCKGGVGKSTTAVNLAYSLRASGASVGIFDADVYGPSLPTMVTPDDDVVRFVGRQVAPLQRDGVKLMSFGYINDGSAIMRGPMVTQLLDQFMSIIQWGPLDYLIIDMPPGTGDIQLTLTQRLNITAAVIVTTPTQLSYIDVVRGIDMFDSVSVPCIAVVENMAYYEIPSSTSTTTNGNQMKWKDDTNTMVLDKDLLKQAITDKLVSSSDVVQNGALNTLAEELVQIVFEQQQKQQQLQQDTAATNTSSTTTSNEDVADGEKKKISIFGMGHKHKLAKQYGIEYTFSMPLLEQIAHNGDNGTPYVLQNPNTAQADIYHNLSNAVVTECAKIKFNKHNLRPTIEYNKEQHIITIMKYYKNDVGDGNAEPLMNLETVKPADLRRDCKCAYCVEEFTGTQLLNKESIPDSVYPIRMYPTGNYALSVDWSDGHRSLYPYKQINSLVSELNGNSAQTIQQMNSSSDSSNSIDTPNNVILSVASMTTTTETTKATTASTK